MNKQFIEFKVRHIARGGAAYATNMDTGEEVFINAALAQSDEIEIGDYIRAVVVPNEKSDEVQWYARVIEVLE